MSANDQEQIIQQWIHHASALARQGKYAESIAAYQKVLTAVPHNIDLRQQVISLATKLGNYSEVIHQHMDCAEIFNRQEDYEAAVERYETVLRLHDVVQGQGENLQGESEGRVTQLIDQVRPEIYFQIGRHKYRLGDHDAAMQYYQKAQALEPSRCDIHLGLGRVFMAKSMTKEAIGEFQEIFRLTSDLEDKPEEAAEAAELLGELFSSQGRGPENTTVWLNLAADGYLAKGRIDDAIRCYEKILDLNPSSVENLEKLGELFYQNNRLEDAIEIYKRLASIHEEAGLLDKVIVVLEQVVEWDNENAWAVNKLIEIFEDVLERNETNHSVRVKLVVLYENRGQVEKLPKHYRSLFEYYTSRGMFDEAISVGQKLIRLDEGTVDIQEQLANVYLEREMKEQALVLFQKVLEHYHSSGDAEAASNLKKRLAVEYPELVDFQYQAILSVFEDQGIDEALAEVNKLLEDKSDDQKALAIKAYFLTVSQDPEADAVLTQALVHPVEDTDYFRLILKSYLLEENYAKVTELYHALPLDEFAKQQVGHKLIEDSIGAYRVKETEELMAMLKLDREEQATLYKRLLATALEREDKDMAVTLALKLPRSDKDRNGFLSEIFGDFLESSDFEQASCLIESLPEGDPLLLSYRKRFISATIESGSLDLAAAQFHALPEEEESREGFAKLLIGAYLESGDVDKATAEILRLDEVDPLRNSFLGQVIELQIKNGQLDSAAKRVQELSDEDKLKPKYRRRIIQAYLNGQEFDQAEHAIFALDDDDPEKRSFLRLLVQKYQVLGKFDRIQTVIQAMPDDMSEKEQYLSGLAHNFLSSGDIAKAREQIYSLAEGCMADGKYDEAESLYREILIHHPGDADLRMRIAQIQFSKNLPERAEQGMLVLATKFREEKNYTSLADVYSKMLEMNSDNYNVRAKLGNLWAEQGQTVQALEQFSTLAEVYLEQNLPEVAQKVLVKILELDPKDIEHRRSNIRLLVRNLRFEDATEQYRELLQVYLERGEVEQALGCVKEILNLQPLNLELRLSLGLMFVRSGFVESGEELLLDLASEVQKKKDWSFFYRIYQSLIEALEDQGNWEGAVDFKDRLSQLYLEEDKIDDAIALMKSNIETLLEYSHYTEGLAHLKQLVAVIVQHPGENRVEVLEKLEDEFSTSHSEKAVLIVQEAWADYYYQQNDVEQSVDLLQGVISSYIQLEMFDRAVSMLGVASSRALESNQHEKSILLDIQQLDIALRLKEEEQVRELIQRLDGLVQDNIDFRLKIGDVLFTHHRYEMAKDQYRAILEIDKNNLKASLRQSVIAARDGRYEEAGRFASGLYAPQDFIRLFSEFKKSISYGKSDLTTQIRYGRFLVELGFTQEAIIEYLECSQSPSKYLPSMNLVAQAFERRGERELAIAQYLKLLQSSGYSDEEMLETRYNLACIFEDSGELDKALGAFQECYIVDIRYRDVAQKIEALSERLQK